jgi:hypothetical protein
MGDKSAMSDSDADVGASDSDDEGDVDRICKELRRRWGPVSNEFLARQEQDWTLISTTAEIIMMPSDSAPETMRNARICPG